MMKPGLTALLLAVCLVGIPSTYADERPPRTEAAPDTGLGHWIRLSSLPSSGTRWLDEARIVHDPEGFLTPLQAAIAATKSPSGRGRIDRYGGDYWLVWPIRNDTDEDEFLLSSYNTLFSSVDFHLLIDGERVQDLEVGRSRDRRHEKDSLPFGWHFRFRLPHDRRARLILHIRSPVLNTPMLDFSPWKSAAPRQWHQKVLWLLGLGMLLAFITYSMLLSLAIRDLDFLWYGLHGFFLTWWLADIIGLLHSISGIPHTTLSMQQGAYVLHQIFALVFGYRFLSVATKTGVTRQLFHTAILVLLLVMLGVALLPPWAVAIPIRIETLLIALLLLTAAVSAVRKGYRPARYYLIGWTGLSFGIIVGALGLQGVITLNSWIFSLLLGGAVLEMLMLALALAERIRALRRDKSVAEAEAAAQGAFIAGVSHELRTPLHGILGLGRQLLDTPLNDAQRALVQATHLAGNSLLRLINDILDYKKLSTGKVELRREIFDLRALVEELIALVRSDANEKDLDFRCRISDDLPLALIGDPERMSQVLMNLLSNAIKFTERGRIDVAVEPARIDSRRAAIDFTVEDTGIGIDAHLGERLFERFTQADSSISKRFGGTGLGLAISRDLVQAMGGEIDYRSRPGRGSRFRVRLTLEVSSVPAASWLMQTTDEAVDWGFLHGSRLLVVDDVALNLELFQTMFAKADCRVDTAADGREAIVRMQGKHYDLVLMDVHMPGLDGLEATRRIRASGDLAVAGTPIVAVTASAMQHERELFLARGFSAVLTKPFAPADLAQLLGSLLPEKRQDCREPGPWLDLPYLAAQAEDSSSALQQQLILQFPTIAGKYLDEVDRAWLEGNAVVLKSHLHRLAGTAAMFGCEALRRAVTSTETRLEAEGITALDEQRMTCMRKRFDQTVEAIRRRFDE